MSLTYILDAKTITLRKETLQSFLRNREKGEVSDDEDKILKTLFHQFYTPDEGQVKYKLEEIDRFFIGIGSYNTKCFRMRLKDGREDVATLKRLAGENRTPQANVKRALRSAIDPQIQEFKNCYPLTPEDICPVQNTPLGTDAEVDHFDPPFHEIADEWLKRNTRVKIYCGEPGTSFYMLKEPFHTSWITYHKEKANLRWLSKEGNKKAHLLPNENKPSPPILPLYIKNYFEHKAILQEWNQAKMKASQTKED
jgi:hypothetical protein